MRSAIIIAAVGLTLASAGEAAAGRFQVNPTSISLSKTAATDAIVVSNHGARRLRVEITVQGWRDDEDGAMQLAPTKDIVVRPSLVEIAGGGSQAIRIGFVGKVPPAEGSYRVFVEELPEAGDEARGQLRVLTRIGVPVFVQPSRPASQLDVQAAITGQRAVVTVTNTGTVHHKLAEVRVRGVVGHQERWHHDAVGWYVLPGAVRRFTLELDGDACSGEAAVVAEVSEAGVVWSSAPLAVTCPGPQR